MISVRYRQAFRETLCCCFLRTSTTSRNTVAYTYIKPTNRLKSVDSLSYYQNGIPKRAFDDDDKTIGENNKDNTVKIIEDEAVKIICPSCNYGNSKQFNTDHKKKQIPNMYPSAKLLSIPDMVTNV